MNGRCGRSPGGRDSRARLRLIGSVGIASVGDARPVPTDEVEGRRGGTCGRSRAVVVPFPPEDRGVLASVGEPPRRPLPLYALDRRSLSAGFVVFGDRETTSEIAKCGDR